MRQFVTLEYQDIKWNDTVSTFTPELIPTTTFSTRCSGRWRRHKGWNFCKNKQCQWFVTCLSLMYVSHLDLPRRKRERGRGREFRNSLACRYQSTFSSWKVPVMVVDPNCSQTMAWIIWYLGTQISKEFGSSPSKGLLMPVCEKELIVWKQELDGGDGGMVYDLMA